MNISAIIFFFTLAILTTFVLARTIIYFKNTDQYGNPKCSKCKKRTWHYKETRSILGKKYTCVGHIQCDKNKKL